MVWEPRQKEIESVLALADAARYSYFVKKVADSAVVWGLWSDGWALAGDDKTQVYVPVWPHAKYAELCAMGESGGVWRGYQPKSIDIDAWLTKWIPGIERDHRLIAVFPTPHNRGVAVDPRRLEADLREELSKYE